jgi:peroxiredoxin (alkyl hydroperoxide reductase subunit C)
MKTGLGILFVTGLSLNLMGFGWCDDFKGMVFDPGRLRPFSSTLKVKVGDRAPDFLLPAISGKTISLNTYTGNKHVVLSFVPAAWTPVCSEQWRDFNKGRERFAERNAVLLGITVDNIPTLFSWTRQMGPLWFPVLSDFWPHGRVSDRYGVLRSDGVSERAVFIIDKTGIIRYIQVHDINKRPLLLPILLQLTGLSK